MLTTKSIENVRAVAGLEDAVERVDRSAGLPERTPLRSCVPLKPFDK
jgi:hypothetical protein